MLKVLITYAIEEERVVIDVHGWDVKYVCTGLGKAKSVMRLMDAIHTCRPDLVINEGTAATLNHGVDDIFVCCHFIDRDFAKLKIPGLDYEQDTTDLLVKYNLFDNLAPTAICNTGDSFLVDAPDSDGDVFDMEAYAEALVCVEKKIPFLAVKCVTDVIGQNSVEDWKDKLTDANVRLTQFFQTIHKDGSLAH